MSPTPSTDSASDHVHPHPHDHPHSHESSGENYSSRAHPEFVVMDVGAGVGGLIIHTSPDLHGQEIHISPAGDDARRSHKDVLERNINGRPAFTAVFDGIPAGSYTLWNHQGDLRARGVVIQSGEIAELDWRSLAPPSAPKPKGTEMNTARFDARATDGGADVLAS